MTTHERTPSPESNPEPLLDVVASAIEGISASATPQHSKDDLVDGLNKRLELDGSDMRVTILPEETREQRANKIRAAYKSRPEERKKALLRNSRVFRRVIQSTDPTSEPAPNQDQAL